MARGQVGKRKWPPDTCSCLRCALKPTSKRLPQTNPKIRRRPPGGHWGSQSQPSIPRKGKKKINPQWRRAQGNGSGEGTDGHERAFTRAAPYLRPHDGSRVQAPRHPPHTPPGPKLGQEEGPPASPEPGLRRLAQFFSRRAAGGTGTRCGRSGPGQEREEGAVLACGRVASAVGRGGRGLRAAPVCAGARSLAAPAAGPLSPAPRARRWWRLARAREQEAAPGMGGRTWPPRPLLCIIVTQAISCLEV